MLPEKETAPAGRGPIPKRQENEIIKDTHIRNGAGSQARFSIITSKRPEILSKKFFLDSKGQCKIRPLPK